MLISCLFGLTGTSAAQGNEGRSSHRPMVGSRDRPQRLQPIERLLQREVAVDGIVRRGGQVEGARDFIAVLHAREPEAKTEDTPGDCPQDTRWHSTHHGDIS